MPQTINQSNQSQIIGGIFSSYENADKAVKAFEELYIPAESIQVVVKINDSEAEDTYTGMFIGRGFSKAQALYHNKVVREGKVFVAIYDVTDPVPIIDIFDKYNAEHNVNGSRNLRDDVLGMTTGAAIGAAVLGAAGGAMAGPAGAVAGITAGAIVGGGSGAVAGKALEHHK